MKIVLEERVMMVQKKKNGLHELGTAFEDSQLRKIPNSGFNKMLIYNMNPRYRPPQMV